MSSSASFEPELQAVVEFHGHLCPGLLIGYHAAKAAAAALGVTAAPDEELVLIAENDSCSVDAFQALLSTTFGKGNLVFVDNGKQVFTLGDRRSGRAVRVALRFDAFAARELTREQKIDLLRERPAEALFHIDPVQVAFPARASVHPTVRCTRCREGVMITRTVTDAGQVYCLPCARDLGLARLEGRRPLVQ
ncbi:MAG: FmdE family protein [Actinobacteria bacterium]|nr:FmdE family protein [Actinomycetota bacterium]